MKIYDRYVEKHLYHFAKIGEPVTMSIPDADEIIKNLRKHKTKKFVISKNGEIAVIWRRK